MKGLNLSSFKKTAEDAKSATMVHEDGHKIVIAKGALSALQRKQLERLPIHMYDAGYVQDPALSDETPAEAAQTGQTAAQDYQAMATPPADAATSLPEASNSLPGDGQSCWSTGSTPRPARASPRYRL